MTAGTSSLAFTVIGLVLNVFGVVLLFRYGMPYRVRRKGAQHLIIGFDAREAKNEQLYNAVGWLGLFVLVGGGALQIIGALTMPSVLWVMNSTPDFWTAFATIGLLVVAVLAFWVAKGQLNAVATERTVKLVKEAVSPEMEAVLGFFDYAADNRVSREAFSALFNRLIKARPSAIADRKVSDVTSAAVEAERLIILELDNAITDTKPAPTEREEEAKLRDRILTATNFFERVYTLIDNRAINEHTFLTSQDYNIVAVYYILEPILRYLVNDEAFDFAYFTDLTSRAQPFLTWLPETHVLREARFKSLRGAPDA